MTCQLTPAEIRKLKKDDAKLQRRIQRKLDRGDHYGARVLLRLRSRTLALRVLAAKQAFKRTRRKTTRRLTWADMEREAFKLDLWKPSTAPIAVATKAKRDGGSRTVLSFAREDKIRQHAMNLLLTPQAILDTRQKLLNGGREQAVSDVLNAIRKGAKWTAVLDISDYYGSIVTGRLPSFLRVSARLLRHNALVGRQRRLVRTQLATEGGDEGDRRNNRSNGTRNVSPSPSKFGSPRGLPQGSSASPLIGEVVAAWMLRQVSSDVVCTTYADNIFVLGRTKKEVLVSVQALESALREHPAGYFRFKFKLVRRIADGFEVLGYQVRTRRNDLIVKPTHHNMWKLETVATAVEWLVLTGRWSETQARDLLRGRVSSFKHWARADHWFGRRCANMVGKYGLLSRRSRVKNRQ